MKINSPQDRAIEVTTTVKAYHLEFTEEEICSILLLHVKNSRNLPFENYRLMEKETSFSYQEEGDKIILELIVADK